MGLPLIPFAAGLAVGALATYGSRDATVQKQFREGAEWVTSRAQWLYATAASGLSGLFGRDTKAEPETPTVIEQMATEAEPKPAAASLKRTRSRKSSTATTAEKTSRPRTRRKAPKAASE